jgi:hypothetical protein
MKGLTKRGPVTSFIRRPALLAGVCLLFLVSCTTVSNRVDRYESNYRYQYGAAEQDQKHSGIVHCEDEFVAMDLAMRDFRFNMDFRMTNKTGGPVTVNWLSVLFELPKGQSTGAVPEGADTTVVAARGEARSRFAPEQDVSLFGIGSEESRASMGNVYADNRIVIRVPVQVGEKGVTKIYLFTYKYRSGVVDLSGDCARMN